MVGCGGGVELGGSAAQAAGSGCDRAKDSIWSRFQWLVGQRPTRNGVVCCHGPVLDHWSGAFGGASAVAGTLRGVASLFLIGVMLVEGYLCRWCAMRMANLAFLASRF